MSEAVIQQTIFRAVKYRAYPTPEVAERIERHFIAVEKIFNATVDEARKYQREHGERMSKEDILSFASSQAKNFPNINHDAAYLTGPRVDYGLKRTKSEGEGDLKYKVVGDIKASFSLRYKHPCYEIVSTKGKKRAKFQIPGVGEILVAYHRPLPAYAATRMCTISRNSAGQYFLSIDFHYNQTIRQPPKIKKPIGLDFSVPKLFVSSEKDLVSNVDMLQLRKRFAPKIAAAHRKLSRCQKGSKNYEKARKKLAKLYLKLDNIRLDYIHKETTFLAKNYDFVGIESLEMKDLAERFKLYKAIQDDSWYKFTAILGYKYRQRQRICHGVSRYYPSSKTCHRCGYINHELTIADRVFICPVCGNRADRDVNAAKNIRDQALRDNGYRINYIHPNNVGKKKEDPNKNVDNKTTPSAHAHNANHPKPEGNTSKRGQPPKTDNRQQSPKSPREQKAKPKEWQANRGTTQNRQQQLQSNEAKRPPNGGQQ